MTEQPIQDTIEPQAEPMPEPESEPVSEPVVATMIEPPPPTFRQSLTAGVNRLAAALDDLDAAGGRRTHAATAVEDARAQVVAAQDQMASASASVDDARAAAVAAFDGLAETLDAGRAALINGQP